MRKLLLGLLFLILPFKSQATCTGSGTVWACTAGTTVAQVNAMISAASNNAVATFASGSYSWTGGNAAVINFSTSRGITLACAVPQTCSVATSSVIFGLFNATAGTVVTNLIRITGFTWTWSSNGQGWLWFEPNCSGAGCRVIVNQLRIDHNVFNVNNTGNGTVAFFGDTTSNLYAYGVMDHNTVNAVGPHPTALWFTIGQYDPTPPLTNSQGTANNMFLEDNVLTVTTNTDTSSPCMTDGWGFASVVVRHNTITNCLEVVHDLGHAGGMQNVEVYNNQFIQNSGIAGQGADDGYRMFHHQGSQVEIYWNNSFKPLQEPHNGATISVNEGYVDQQCSSYPCGPVPDPNGHGPQPGRDMAGNLVPIYVWGNFSANNGTLVGGGNESSGTYVAQNRDLYVAVSTSAQTSPTSPFNGTVGMGFGTLANRPTTCTHSNSTNPTLSPRDDGHGGVGYAVETVVGTIGASSGSGTASDAQLYTCTATNTWTLLYTPYTYPHPLTQSGSAPQPPTSLTITTQ